MIASSAPSAPHSTLKMESTRARSHSRRRNLMRLQRFPRCSKYLFVFFTLTLSVRMAVAQQPASPDYAKIFNKIDVMIAARDGVKLHTEIYAPKNNAEPLPIILERTPYGTS